MLNKDAILEKLSDKKAFLEQNYSVKRIGLFGSFAKNSSNENSDIDFYVEFKEKNFDNLSGLWVFLEELYNKKVDIFHKHKNNNPVILKSIQKEVIFG